jgi:hypothetical protein
LTTEISEMYCTCCGNKGISIPRKSNKFRGSGHLKKIYCIYCKAEKNHVEIRPIYSNYNYDDFQLEMKYNNFDSEGNRKEPYHIFKSELKKRGVI